MDYASVSELIAAGRSVGTPVNLPGHQPGVIIPETYKFQAIPFADPTPLLPYIKQSTQLSDSESFISYVKRFKTKDTVVFATLPQRQDGAGAEFRAVFDYHVGGKGDDQKAAYCAHQAFFPCPLSTNWNTWFTASGKGMSQDAFVNFVEANTPDIVSPESAVLMEMAINFESKTEVEFLSKINRVTGARTLTFNETVSNGNAKTAGTITVPDQLKLKLPVFEGGKHFDAVTRLEWKPSNGKLVVTIHLLRPQDIIRTALADLRNEISAGVEIEPMTGRLA